jgi:hypothetical protein
MLPKRGFTSNVYTMGRQIAVAMTNLDEAEFLAFLTDTADIQLLESFAPTKEGIFVSQFSPRRQGHWTYDIWNKAFDWKIEYKQVRQDVPKDRNPGWFYISNTHNAPPIEYSRHNFANSGGLSYGRIYWSKYFAAEPHDIHYDVDEFSAWYDIIARWIRKNGKKKEKRRKKVHITPTFFQTP